MEKINRYDSHVIRTKQWMAILLLAIPMGVHALGMLGLASAFAGKLPINSISYLLPALGFFFLWQIASNTATRIAAKIATESGADMVIANGGDVSVVESILSGMDVGTLFVANKNENFQILDYLME